MIRNRREFTSALGGVVAASVAPRALAQATPDYPARPVRIVVPFAPGGATDVLARMIGGKLTEAWGQQVVVENKPGAGGNIGAEAGARAAADGYTLTLCAAGFMAVNPSLYAKLPYDPVRDFAPIALVATAPFVLAVHPSLPVTSVKEFIAYAKARPGKLNYGAVPGAAAHLASEMFRMASGIDAVHVPYKGAGPATTDVIAGQIQFTFASTPGAIPHVKAGKLRALAVTSPKRVSGAPDLPTVAEGGGPAMSAQVWYGVVAPARTPREIVQRLYAEIDQIVKQPAMRERMQQNDFEPALMDPAAFGAFIRSEIATWAKVVKAAGIKAD
jgi:tripartite-type tricarboxylate transporter receptor subunit TctC